MTNTPGDGQTPQDPSSGQPGETPPGETPPGQNQPAQDQRGYWEQQSAAPGQQPYGQAPGYPPQAPMQYAPDHPKATTVLVLGIVSLVLCQVVGPFAWSMGKSTLAEIDASNGRVGGRGAASAGYILGIISTILLGLGVLFFVGVLGLAVLGVVTSDSM